jgi:hypothetical protein
MPKALSLDGNTLGDESVTVYQTAWRNNAGNSNIHIHIAEDLKSFHSEA